MSKEMYGILITFWPIYKLQTGNNVVDSKLNACHLDMQTSVKFKMYMIIQILSVETGYSMETVFFSQMQFCTVITRHIMSLG